MAHPVEHAQSSARKFGGRPEDYLAIHRWFDESKAFFPDFRHRALRHHAEGIFLAERIWGHGIQPGWCRRPGALYRRTTYKRGSRTNPHRPGLAGANQP